ncbi:MAG: glutathione peroxidase [Lentisphaeraceae bacterium]|nr:glutathione peroxidase [Lentisphaeraceae bacterium]
MRQLLILFTLLAMSFTLKAENAHSFKVKDIDGKDFDMNSLKGKVVLVVNVASKCGLTPQYKDLQAMYEKYNKQGFEVVGFPANNFGKQEPGDNFQIKEFCTTKYKVTFPMMSKVDVRKEKTPLYKYLTEHKKFGGDIKWNFEKFLIGPDGEVITRFSPKTKPKSKKVVEAIEKALKDAK